MTSYKEQLKVMSNKEFAKYVDGFLPKDEKGIKEELLSRMEQAKGKLIFKQGEKICDCPECGAEIQHGFSDKLNILIRDSRLFKDQPSKEEPLKCDNCGRTTNVSVAKLGEQCTCGGFYRLNQPSQEKNEDICEACNGMGMMETEYQRGNNTYTTPTTIPCEICRSRPKNKENELREVLKNLLGIINDSNGVYGYHLNGDDANWDEFEEVETAKKALE